MAEATSTTDAARVAAALSACEGIPTSDLAAMASSSATGLLAKAMTAVFLGFIADGDFEYLRGETFHGEDPEDVRADFSDAIEETLSQLGLESTAELCGALGNSILLHLPTLARFLEATTDQ